MKHPLIALTLLAAAPLSAGYHDQPNQYESEDNCYSCNPCCTPQPKKCIDCECYTPAFYDLQCDWGLFLSVDFLYWYARETNLNYATEVTGAFVEIGPEPTVFWTNANLKNFGTDWEPGVRMSIGFNSSCDGWDSSAAWTYMCNKRTDSSSSPVSDLNDLSGVLYSNDDTYGERTMLVNPWFYLPIYYFNGPEVRKITDTGWEKISASWSLQFNQLDIDLGRKYWLSQCFTLRPFAGIRLGWIDTKLQIDSSVSGWTIVGSGNPDLVVDASSKTQSINSSWGAGLITGFQPNWYFCSNFILYANLDAALLWGEFKSKTKQRVTASGPDNATDLTNSFTGSNNFYMMQPVIDLAIGLRWEETWCCERYRTSLDLGWEHSVWFDYNHRLKYSTNQQSLDTKSEFPTGPSLPSYEERTGNLMMGGLVVRARFDF